MLFQKEVDQNPIKIKGYQDGKINVSGTQYDSPLLLTATEVQAFETVTAFSALTAEMLIPVIPDKTEIILIGCGKTQQFMPASDTRVINELGIAVEVMGTRQACHTFQVLTFENRKIVALLFPE